MSRAPFHSGQRVVCIDDSTPSNSNFAPALLLGGVYTVSDCRLGYGAATRRPAWGVFIAEAKFPSFGGVHGWMASRFEAAE